MSGPAPALPVSPPWGLSQGGQPVVFPPSDIPPGGIVMAPPQLQIPLPEVFPIPDAKEFNPLGQQATAAVTPAPVEIPGTVFDVPDGTFGVIRGVTLYITDMLTTTDVVWSLIINQASPQGFNQITIFPRTAPFVSNGFDAAVRFNGPARLSVVFRNNDGGTYVVGASISGWYWPEASDARWRRTGR